MPARLAPRPQVRGLERTYAQELRKAARLAEGFIGSEVLAKLGRLDALSELAAEGDAQTRRMLAPVIEVEVAALVGNAERKHTARLAKLAEPLATRAMQRVTRSQAKTHRRQMEALTEGMDVVQVLALAHQAATQRAQRGGVLGDATSIKLTAGGGVQHPENEPWGSGDFGLGLSTPGLQQAMNEAVAENVDLITRLPERLYRDLRKRLAVELRQGRQIDQLHQVVSDELLNAKRRSSPMAAVLRRARLIARDQVGKFHGKLDEQRQQGAGITHYRWRTVRDERVRGGPKYRDAVPSHAHREGKIFAWANPPHEDKTDGHPGRPIQCRCYPEPVLGQPGAVYRSEPPQTIHPDATSIAVEDAISKLSLDASGQIEPGKAKALREALRSFLDARGVQSRVVSSGGTGVDSLLLRGGMGRTAGLHNMYTGEVTLSTTTYSGLQSKSRKRKAQSVGVVIHEEGHGGGPCGVRKGLDGWESAYDGCGVVIEESTNEFLAHKWTNSHFGPSVRVYSTYINRVQASFIKAGLARDKSASAKLMERASLAFRQIGEPVYSEKDLLGRWLEAVEHASGTRLTQSQKDELWWGVQEHAPLPRWLKKKKRGEKMKKSEPTVSDKGRPDMDRDLEEAKKEVLWAKSRGDLDAMHLHILSRLFGGAFLDWIASEGITPDIEPEDGQALI